MSRLTMDHTSLLCLAQLLFCLSSYLTENTKYLNYGEPSRRDIIVSVCRSSCEVSVILVRFQQKLEYVDNFSKTSKPTISQKNLTSESRAVLCGHRRMDRHDKANSRFSHLHCKTAY